LGARRMATFTVGDEASVSTKVCEANTAIAMKSGSLPVFATPSLVALMEEAACKVLQGGLEAGETTVGTKMDVSHDAASGVGANIKAFARVDEVDGKKTTLLVWASDEAGIVGRGSHERATVKAERLVAKAKERLHGGLSCPQ